MIIAIIKKTSTTCYYLNLSENNLCEELEDQYCFNGQSELEDCDIDETPTGTECDKEVTIHNDYSGRNYKVKPIVVD